MLPFEISTKSAQQLCDESLSVRKPPVNFDERDRMLFQHEFQKTIPATQLLELNHANVSSDGIVFSAIRILAECFGYRNQFLRWASSKNLVKFFVKNYALKTRLKLDDNVFWVIIIDNWSSAYFHWLMDALPRLYMVRDWLADSTLLLPESYKAWGYIIPSLAPFATREIKFIESTQVFRCRRLLVPSHTAPSGNYNEKVMRGLRQMYRDHYRGMVADDPADRVYISRAKARMRKIINENDVIAVLKEHGFRIVVLEEHPFEQQVKFILNARHLVSNHGAGLTNMLFLPPGSSVLEFRKCDDGHNNCYFALASALELKYYYQLCKPENPDENAYSANVHVDLEIFRKNLELMLASDDVRGVAFGG
jgi:capsular polysaccharide biosynthesis protein